MNSRKKGELEASGRLNVMPAGGFSEWLHNTEVSLNSGTGEADVPCGICTACCRSFMFIHIRPEEKRTLRRIPRVLLFPAPGMPKGHRLMGYDEKGHCPMLVEGRCSIYEHRPQTCRDYDCRVFAATGIAVDQQTQPDIADRVGAWEFQYESQESRREQTALKKAAAFLQKNRGIFPQGSLPEYPPQLAALAVRMYRIFYGPMPEVRDASSIPDTVIARRIMAVLKDRRKRLKSL